MRPIERGSAPGQAFASYHEAKEPLANRIGEYCSYCESRVNAGLAVEHIHAKAEDQAGLREWENFLLSCVHCNSTKGKRPVTPGEHYWPHLDNTARALEYLPDGRITVHSELDSTQRRIAQNTIDLTGLGRVPPNVSALDRRWLHRRDTWSKAVDVRDSLAGQDTPTVRKLITELAVATGHWSIWMAVFSGDADMRRRFIAAFVGTSATCFDADTIPVRRTGGAL